MTTLPLTASQTATHGVSLPRRAGMLRQMTRAIFTFSMRRATRKSLGRLDDRLLRDIGVDPLHARQEVAKPFWLS